MIESQLLDALKRHGVSPIDAEGQVFDPNLHQAVMRDTTAHAPSNTVVKVLERGFTIHDRVLRPASVIVAVPESSVPETPGKSSAENETRA